MKARIGIPLPTTRDNEYNERCWPEYAAAVQAAGAEAIPLRLLDPSFLRGEIARCDGFILPGSPADVDPDAYGHTRDGATAPPDSAREACDRAVLDFSGQSGSPVLGICFGLQIVNVLQGGTLVHDLRPVPVNHSAGAQVGVAHTVLVVSMSLLGGLLGVSEIQVEGQFRRLPVNSSHHQSVAIPGQDFTVVARASEDGVIEAIEGRIGLAPFLGVQWHPERSVSISAASRALFQWLVLASEDARDVRTASVDAH